jgi:hypothetical protein
MSDNAIAAPAAQHHDQPPRRAQMLRYGLWQMRDYAMERGLPTMIIALLVGWLVAMPVRVAIRESAVRITPRLIAQYGSAAAARHALADQASRAMLGQFVGAIVFLGALLAMSGLVSNDRKNGFYKLLFAKPVAPERYYGQAFLVHGLGFLVALLLLGLAWSAYVAPVTSGSLLLVMMLMYVCYAGVAFLLSAASRWDWLSLVVVALVSTELWQRFGDSTSPLAKLLYLLPPLTKVSAVYAAATSTQPVAMPWGTVAWLAGYGAVCYLAGLIVLHHRRLATP